jgi:hypothetical protein
MAVTINASTSAGLVQTADTSGVLQLQTANTTALTVDASQNVGIGTTTTTQKLNVYGADASNNVASFSRSSGATMYTYVDTGNNVGIFSGSNASGGGFYANTSDNSARIMAGSADRMRIDSSGNLYLNTTTRRNNGMQSIDYNGSAAGGMGINDTVSSNASPFIAFLTGGTFRGSITNNNNTAVAYNTTSDYRLKENIVPMIGALDTISKLKPVTYTWKQDGSNGQGFIAHELQETVPDCVTGEKDAVDADGNPKYQGVDTSFLVATLTAAIQEQQTIIKTQSESIDDLKARIETLEGAA